jgi:hypothetical protein
MVCQDPADMAVTWEEEELLERLSTPEPEEPPQLATNDKNEKQIKRTKHLRILNHLST